MRFLESSHEVGIVHCVTSASMPCGGDQVVELKRIDLLRAMYAGVKHNPNFVDARVIDHLSLPAKTLTLAAIVKRDAWLHRSGIIGLK